MTVIDSLSAGFRFVGRRGELLLIPILIDIFLWVSPRLSAAPLLEKISTLYTDVANMPGVAADTAALSSQVAVMLHDLGESANLYSMLANRSLMHVPSIMALITQLQASGNVQVIGDPGPVFVLTMLLSLTGMLMGVLYLQMLAMRLPLGDGAKQPVFRDFLSLAVRHWLWLLVFVLGIAAAMVLLSIPASVVMLLLAIISPALLSGIVLIMGGLFTALLFYLYFVVAGVILDNLPLHVAIWRSVNLVRHNFWATLGFILLTNLISLGFSLIWEQFLSATSAPWEIVVAVLGNAYIGTGLAMALLVFYRTRLLKTAEQIKTVSEK